MKRFAIVRIDDADVTDIGIQPLDIDAGTAYPMFYVPAPPDDQLARDIESAIVALENEAKELHSRERKATEKGHHPAARTLGKRVARTHGQAARLRVAFRLSEGK